MLNTIKSHLKNAMISKDKKRMATLRNILAKLKLKEIEKREQLTDAESLKVLQSISKQLKDSIDQYKKGNRDDLVQKESEELEILNEFLPELAQRRRDACGSKYYNLEKSQNIQLKKATTTVSMLKTWFTNLHL